MANSVGLCIVVSNLVYIDLPGVISGHSKKSTGGMGGEKKHHGEIEAQKHLPLDTAANWSKQIPKFWSGPTIYAESARMALLKTNNESHFKFNYPRFYAFCIMFEHKYLNKTLKVLFSQPQMILSVCYYLFSLLLFRCKNYLQNYFKYKKGSTISLNAKDINNAQIGLLGILSVKYPKN
jgi:hypothetical protein